MVGATDSLRVSVYASTNTRPRSQNLRRWLSSFIVEHLNQEIRLSASFGVAAMLPTDTSWPEILRRGDRALYLAKERGRDRVAVP
jgi:PleD family two-component response regulator